MTRIRDIFKQASRHARLVFLLAFLAVTIFNGIWVFHRFHLSAPLWLIPLWALPWWYWLMPVVDLFPSHLRSVAQVASLALGFAINSSSAYILIRAAVVARRPNNSFKPKPLRGSA